MIYTADNLDRLTPALQRAVRRMFISMYRLRPANYWMEPGNIEAVSDAWAQALYDEAAVFRMLNNMSYFVEYPSSCKGVRKPPPRSDDDPEDPAPAPRRLLPVFNHV